MRSVPAGPWYPFAPSGGETIAHMVTSCRSTWVAAVLLMLVSGAVGAQAAGGTAELELVPHPDLSGLSPEIRERLEPATEYFRSQRATLEGRSLADWLLAPTQIYVKPLLSLCSQLPVHALAHITGGGLPGNVIRVLPEGTRAVIERSRWEVPHVFEVLQRKVC